MNRMTSETIKKYDKYSVAQLKAKAQVVFNKWIRERDKCMPCINCGKQTKLQAGHFYPAGSYNALRFDEDNVHGECLHCNYFNSQSHSYGYAVNLPDRIGVDRMEALKRRAVKRAFKWDRFSLISIIEKYKL